MTNINLEDLAGLKIKTESVPASLISIIKKYRRDSISDIKNDILNDDFVFSCNFSGNCKQFTQLINLHDDLVAAGYNVKLFDEGEESNIEYFRNWLESTMDTASFVDADPSYCDKFK
jgi:hypothetical protein